MLCVRTSVTFLKWLASQTPTVVTVPCPPRAFAMARHRLLEKAYYSQFTMQISFSVAMVQ